MREIKFRAFYKPNRKMYEVLTLDIIDQKALIENNDNPEVPLRGYSKMSDMELIQYTGLKDKHQKEIYEGDIVEYFNNELAVVVYEHGSFWIKGIHCMDSYHELRGYIEVIGNIYENSELLEGTI